MRRLSVILLVSMAIAALAVPIVVFRVLDHDRDGAWVRWADQIDCNDRDPDIRPGMKDLPLNGIDEDCSGFDSAAGSNLVLVTFDALRARNLGAHGYFRDTAPNVDKLARGGVVFLDAFSASSWTIPSLASILTSLYPNQHGASKVQSGLDDRVPLLAETLKQAGYQTAMFFTSAYPLDEMGYSRGFDVVGKHPVQKMNEIREWLRTHQEGKFFLWIHYYKPHTPYVPSPRFDGLFESEKLDDYRHLAAFWNANECRERYEKFRGDEFRIRMAFYDECIRDSDHHFGLVLRELDLLDLARKTLVIFSSDHGEEFFEHEGCDHGRTLYDEVVHVPLIMRHPSVIQGGVVREGQVRTIDIVPTVLDFLEIEGMDVMGVSLRSHISGENLDLPVYTGFLQNGQPSVSLRHGGFKLIHSPREGTVEFYDLEKDPEEEHNLAGAGHPRFEEFENLVLSWIDETSSMYPSRQVEFDDETVEKLEALGYMVTD